VSEPPAPSHNQSPFDAIRHEDEQGEWWSARELAKLLTYSKWQNFQEVIGKAKTAAANSGELVDRHFTDISKVTPGGKHGHQTVKDVRLTRYACYLIAQNADPEKDVVAQAQTYFAVQTRRQEVAGEEADFLEWRERAIASYVHAGYSVDWATRRVDGIVIRKKLTHEWSVRGIEDKEFAILTDRLHMGSFGLSIQQHMGLKDFPVTYKGKKAVYKGDLRPALTALELAITGLGETVARELHITRDSQGFGEIARDVDDAGKVAADARRQIEELTGKPVVSPRNMIREPDGGLWGQLPSPEDE